MKYLLILSIIIPLSNGGETQYTTTSVHESLRQCKRVVEHLTKHERVQKAGCVKLHYFKEKE